MTTPKRDKRIPVMFSEKEVEAIDTWRHANRIPTRAKAIRALCKFGLPPTLVLPWHRGDNSKSLFRN